MRWLRRDEEQERNDPRAENRSGRDPDRRHRTEKRIPMAMPVKTDGETWGYLVGVYKYDMLSDVLGAIHIGQSGMAIILNEEGRVVGHPQEDVVRQSVNIYELDTAESAHQIFDRMITRETGSAEGIVNGGTLKII